MPDTAQQLVDRTFREFRRYTGDGLPNPPSNAPLPVGDPQSGPHSPKKSEIRAAIGGVLGETTAALERAEELEASLNLPEITPEDASKILFVLPDASGYGLREEQQINYEIGDGTVALNKLVQIPPGRVIGRASGSGTGAPQLLTFDQIYTPPPVGGSEIILSPRDYGAVGDGDPANAAADTAGLTQALAALCALDQGATLDLQGGNYCLNDTVKAPTRSGTGNIRITNGTLRFISSVPTGTKYLLDLSPTGTIYYGRMDNVNLIGVSTSNIVVAQGGVKIAHVATFYLSNCTIHGFTQSGVVVLSSAFGQHFRVIDCHIQAYTGSGPFPSSSVGVDFYGGDSWISGCTIGDCGTCVRLRNGSNSLVNNHIWNISTTSIRGVVCDIAQGMMFVGNYIDTVQVELKGATSGFHFHGNLIASNRFYCPPDGLGGASSMTGTIGFIKYSPQAANSWVADDVIVANSFSSDNGRLPMNVQYSTANGTVGVDKVGGFFLKDNSGFGTNIKGSHLDVDIFVNGTSSTADVSSRIPFGRINYITGGTIEGGTPVALALTKSGAVVTATISPSANVVVHASVSININQLP